jgi:hypothetical protein
MKKNNIDRDPVFQANLKVAAKLDKLMVAGYVGKSIAVIAYLGVQEFFTDFESAAKFAYEKFPDHRFVIHQLNRTPIFI